MLSIDPIKKIVYEYRGVDVGKIPSRCRRIEQSKLSHYAKHGWRMFDLSEFVIVAGDRVVSSKSWPSRADAEYEIKRMDLPDCIVRRTVDVMELL